MIPSIGFSNGAALSLCAVAGTLTAVAVAVELYRDRRREAGSLLAKGLAIVLMSIAVSEPFAESSSRVTELRVLLDVSDSMNGSQADELLSRLPALKKGEAAYEIRPFAKSAAKTAIRTGAVPSFGKTQAAWESLDIGATSLEDAMRAEMEEPPPALMLISDGNETIGDIRALASAAGRLPRIFPLLPDSNRARADTFGITKLHAPLVAPAQKSVDVRVSLLNSGAERRSGKLSITHDGKPILERNVELAPGEESVMTAQTDPAKEGIKEVRAVFEPDDRSLSPSEEKVFVTGEAGQKVLLVSGTPEDERHLREILTDQAHRLESVLTGQLGSKLPVLPESSVVILNNVAVKDLPAGAAAEIKRYVEGGGSLITSGGTRGFGLGGYMNTPLADVLPVDPLPPQTEKKRVSAAVALVLDKSGSMKQNNRMAYAIDGAREVIRNLKDEDYVGVIGFDKAPFVAVRMGRLAEIRNQAINRLDMIIPNGPTNLVPAIEEARRNLMRTNAGRKHMMVLTDGQVPDSGPFYLELVKDLRISGITVSTILLGGESDDGLLKSMAEIGGGAFYFTVDPRSLTRVFLSDLRVATGERTMKEEQDYLVRPGPAEQKSTRISGFPPLKGYVQTRAKAKASLELTVQGAERSDPLLASWDYGKGRSIAFTSDASGRWSAHWVRWPRFREFWTDLVEAALPKDAARAPAGRFDLRHYYRNGRLFLDISVYTESGSGLTAELRLPDGSTRPVALETLSAGHFLGSLDGALAGRYELSLSSAKARFPPVSFFLSGALFGEKRDLGFNLPNLEWLASFSGGVVNPRPEDLGALVTESVRRIPLDYAFYLASLLVLCLDLLARGLAGRRRRSRNIPLSV